jgi:hypothetical protein
VDRRCPVVFRRVFGFSGHWAAFGSGYFVGLMGVYASSYARLPNKYIGTNIPNLYQKRATHIVTMRPFSCPTGVSSEI